MEYQIAALIVTMLGVIVAIVKLWLSSREKMALHKEFVITEIAVINQKTLDNQKDIQEHKHQTDLRIEELKRDKSEQLSDIYQEIENIKNRTENDINKLSNTFEKAIQRHVDLEEKHHSEVMGEIKNIVVKLAETIATFNEYRKGKGDK